MANETFELYSLTSKLALDTAQFDRAYGDSQRKMRSLAGDVKQLEAAAKSSGAGISSSLGGALSEISPKLGALTSVGAVGLAVAGLGSLFSAATAAAAGIWELTKRFSDAGSELQDLSDQLNISTDTLGTFQGIGKSVGVEVEQLSAGIVRFHQNLAKGNEVFKALGVTSKDNETALRQTFKAISQMTDATQQSAVIMEVFGRSGKGMLAIIKATDGDLDAATAKLRKWNVLLSQEAIAIADEFGDKLAELGMRAQGVGNTFATETAPAFIAGFAAIEAALDSNGVQWRWWGEQIAKVILSVETILGGLAYAISQMGSNFSPGKFLQDIWVGMNKTADIIVPAYNRLANPTVGVDVGGGPFRRGYKSNVLDWSPGGGGGGGRKGKSEAQREAERLMEQRVDFIERLNTDYRKLRDQVEGVDTSTRAYAVAESRLTGILKDASPELIKQAEAIAQNIDKKEKQLKLQGELRDFLTRQAEAVKLAVEGERGHTQATDEFIKSLERQGAVLQDTTTFWARFNSLILDTYQNIGRLAENINKVTEAFPLPEFTFPESAGEYAGPDIDRPYRIGGNDVILGLPPDVMKLDPLAGWHRIAQSLAYDLTYTIDNAIREGFRSGVGAGVKEFALGIMEMAKHDALRELQRAIANALGGGDEENGGGGGWIRLLLTKGIPAILGGLGGGASTGGLGSGAAGAVGGKAVGGYIPPFATARFQEYGKEYVTAGPSGATVIPDRGSGISVYMTVLAQDAPSFNRRETQTQIRNRMMRELRTAV